MPARSFHAGIRPPRYTGKRKASGRTRCGAILSRTRRSRLASKTRWNARCSRYRMPPWMRRDECEDVPAPKSDLSTSAVRKPRNAASRAIPAPVMPPPITSTSTGVRAMDARAAARFFSNSPPLGAGGRFPISPELENAFPLSTLWRGGQGVRRRRENLMPGLNGRRVAVVAGVRTPFTKAGTSLKDARAVDLARYAARELLERTNLDGAEVDEVIFGQVVPSALVPNIGREVSLLPQLPKEIPAYSLNRACASANQAITAGQDQIALGNANVIIAGGAEALSDIPILASRRLADILVEASKAKSLPARVKTFAKIRPKDLVPVAPAIAEPSTGMSMGQSAEKMAKENHISREAQDRWALRSHQLAAQGTADGRLTAEIVPWLPTRPGEAVVQRDNGIRADTSLEQMAKLKPVFDRRYGSVTAANSSPLTDGASAVLLMGDEKARALGFEPLSYIRSYAVAAVDPGWQLLQAPIWAVPKALERAGIQWKDLGLIEIHEAFASQVLSNLQGFAAKGWEINEDIINVMGGSIAIGHPFGATGGRLVTTLSNEMRRRDVQFGLISVCAQGGMAFAMVLERR